LDSLDLLQRPTVTAENPIPKKHGFEN